MSTYHIHLNKKTMKKLLLFLTLVPSLSIGQVSNWRQGSNNSSSQSNSTPPPSSTNNTNRSVDRSPQISNWRQDPPSRQTQNYYTPPRRPLSPFYSPNYFGPNRWFGWGAPMYFDYWTPSFYYNNWGYREPARIYYREGRQDTVRGRKVHFSFGFQTTAFKDQVGGWFTIGDRTYFIGEFNVTINRDDSYFVSNKTIWNYYNDVMIVNGTRFTINQLFPLQKDVERNNSYYVGLGRKIKRTGFHFMVGLDNTNLRYRYKDDIGFITFPKSDKKMFTVKVGALRDIGIFTVKLDVDPVTRRVTAGTGLNF
jgi:hypothetical protein